MDIWNFVIFILLWLTPLLIGALITSFIGYKIQLKTWILGAIMQIVSLLTVLILSISIGFKLLGLNFSLNSTIIAIFILPLALLIGYITEKINKKDSFIPEFVPESKSYSILLFLFLAPISEEFLYRGLLEGYLLVHSELWFAIIAPAILFSIIHFAPFKNASKKMRITVIVDAFILGIIAGFLRAYGNSIIPPIIAHMEFNLYGVLKNP